MNCPVSFKLKNLSEIVKINENEQGDKQQKYFQKTNDGKQILRDVMSRYIPQDITQAEKQGFSAPDASWFKGESIEFVKNRLMNGKSGIYEYFDQQAVQALINEHLSGKNNRRLLIWSLLSFDEYLKVV